jgi:hypothetical protein
MKIAHIAPTNALKQISSKGDIEFCLAPYAEKDKIYRQYFINARKKRRYVILDNGVAEDILISDDGLVNLAVKMGVNEIIVPDIISDYENTKNHREEFLFRFYKILKEHNIKIQSVVQGKNISEYWLCYNELLKDKRVDIIGIPFRINYARFHDAETNAVNHMLNRLVFIMGLPKKIKPLHCLGSNLPQEIGILEQLKVRSIDSKLMARYGLSEMMYTKYDIEKPKRKIYIDKPLTKKQIGYTIKNIQKLNIASRKRGIKWLIKKK